RDPACLEEAHQAPESGATPIFVDRLHAQMALPDEGRRADDLGKEGFRRVIAMQDGVLTTFLVIDDDLQGKARSAGPLRLRRVPAVAHHVARIWFAHAAPVNARSRRYASGTVREKSRL